VPHACAICKSLNGFTTAHELAFDSTSDFGAVTLAHRAVLSADDTSKFSTYR